jgi:hypothetical protein
MRVTPPRSGLGPGSLPHWDDLFTDRDDEARSFSAALGAFRRLLDKEDDAGTARCNVLVFHGVGGIGKTALSAQLEAWVKGDLLHGDPWGSPPPTEVAATVRIDLHGSAGQVDLGAALVALRSGVARIRRRWPVFDLAFAAYWSAVRPGEPLPSFQGRDELAGAVLETIHDALGDLGSVADLTGMGTGSGLAIRAIRGLIHHLRRRRDIRLALDAFDGFETFMLRCADEPSPSNPDFALVCEIAGILSWELARIKPCPLVVVFIDAAERLMLDARRISEGYVNTLIYQMPNVLFFVTGRDRLDWADGTRSDLPYRGTWTWPGLSLSMPEKSHQHLVSGLSPHDARIMAIRGRDQLDLPVSDQVIDELVAASGGLPQYLELARQVAISVKSAGRRQHVSASDVTGSLGSLVRRVLDDVPADEQRAIRAAALFRTFNLDLMAAAADVDYGCAERAVQRPMIDCIAGQRLPYRMHDAIRDAIRNAGPEGPGGWSERDWQLAASRAASAARRLHDNAKARESHVEVLDAIGVAIRLACDQSITLEPSPSPTYEDWLARAIVYGPSVQGLRSRIPAESQTEYGRVVLDFVSGKSIDIPINDRVLLLRKIFDSDHPLRLPAGRHLGYTLKLQHRWEDALAVFDELVRLAPTAVNRRQRPQVLSLARRFADAREAAKEIPDWSFIERVAEYAHGRPGRYWDEIPAKITRLREAGRQREYLEEMGDLLIRRAFFRGEAVEVSEVDTYLEEADYVGHMVAIRSALLAKILHRGVEPAELTAHLDRLKSLDQSSSPTGTLAFRFAFGEVCDSFLSGPRSRLARLREEIGQVDFRTRSWIPVECFLDLAGLPLAPTPTQWLEPYDVVLERWRGHLNRYLATHGGATIDARRRTAS